MYLRCAQSAQLLPPTEKQKGPGQLARDDHGGGGSRTGVGPNGLIRRFDYCRKAS